MSQCALQAAAATIAAKDNVQMKGFVGVRFLSLILIILPPSQGHGHCESSLQLGNFRLRCCVSEISGPAHSPLTTARPVPPISTYNAFASAIEVPGRGLEPLRISPPDPKSGASANFATLASIADANHLRKFTLARHCRNYRSGKGRSRAIDDCRR
jgi:hypothetical protein